MTWWLRIGCPVWYVGGGGGGWWWSWVWKSGKTRGVSLRITKGGQIFRKVLLVVCCCCCCGQNIFDTKWQINCHRIGNWLICR